jgi:hypothetical protein
MKVEVAAIKALNDFMDAAPEITPRAASLAMNTIIPRSGMKRYRDAMKSQVAFPAGYLDETEKFGVTRFATPSSLETHITARQRPTSLARFATGGGPGTEGVRLTVKKGRTTTLKKAFLVRLKAGTQLTGENYNLGVAVRVPAGQAFRNKKDSSKMVRLSSDVFLLYGPSVDQVFKGVSVTETPQVLNDIETEFYRQFGRLS